MAVTIYKVFFYYCCYYKTCLQADEWKARTLRMEESKYCLEQKAFTWHRSCKKISRYRLLLFYNDPAVLLCWKYPSTELCLKNNGN